MNEREATHQGENQQANRSENTFEVDMVCQPQCNNQDSLQQARDLLFFEGLCFLGPGSRRHTSSRVPITEQNERHQSQ